MVARGETERNGSGRRVEGWPDPDTGMWAVVPDYDGHQYRMCQLFTLIPLYAACAYRPFLTSRSFPVPLITGPHSTISALST